MQPWLCRREQGLTSLHMTSLKNRQYLDYSLTLRADVAGQTSEPPQDIPASACPAEQGMTMPLLKNTQEIPTVSVKEQIFLKYIIFS